MSCRYQIWKEETLTKKYCTAGVEGHAGVNWGQPGVKLLRNALWIPDLEGSTPDWSVTHWWGRRSCQGQSEGNCPKYVRSPICDQCRFSIRAEKINNVEKNIIVYFVIALIMPIGSLVIAILKEGKVHTLQFAFNVCMHLKSQEIFAYNLFFRIIMCNRYWFEMSYNWAISLM